MKSLDKRQFSKEVGKKYALVNNSLRQRVKDNPADRIVVEVGDTKQSDFYPQVKINRWGDDDETNEVNFSIRYKDEDYSKGGVEFEGEKVKWKTHGREVHMYDKPDASDEGGFEIEIFLAEKPDTNRFDFTIQTKGLNFYYQPEITDEEAQEQMVEEDKRTLEEVKRSIRPDNVVGSYAVYHATKRDNRVGGKEYKTGKFCHIYRPHITDADGNETWGELELDEEAGILTVVVPQAFLDKASYPVIVDPTFGYTSVGGSFGYITDRRFSRNRSFRMGNPNFLAEAGNLDSIHAALAVNTGGSQTIHVSAYLNREDSADGVGPHSQVAFIERTDLSFSTTPTWYFFGASDETLIPDTYILNMLGSGQTTATNTALLFYRDSVDLTYYLKLLDNTNSYNALKENPWDVNRTDTSGPTFTFSVYATYTAAASDTNPQVKVSGSFGSYPVKVKQSGTFEDATMKVKVGGSFQ